MNDSLDDLLTQLLRDIREQEARAGLKDADEHLLDAAWEAAMKRFSVKRLSDPADTFAADDLVQLVIEEYRKLKQP
jgi:hypothetical protein